MSSAGANRFNRDAALLAGSGEHKSQDRGLVLDDVANEVLVQGMSQDLMDLKEALAERVQARQSRKH